MAARFQRVCVCRFASDTASALVRRWYGWGKWKAAGGSGEEWRKMAKNDQNDADFAKKYPWGVYACRPDFLPTISAQGGGVSVFEMK